MWHEVMDDIECGGGKLAWYEVMVGIEYGGGGMLTCHDVMPLHCNG